MYDAPLALVWDAWTDPAHVVHWWGPRGFSLTTHSKDLRPGGTWVYTMHGPDGTDYPNFTRYHEVKPRAKLVYDHGASSADVQPMFRVTATFRDLHGKTELDMRMTFPSEEVAQQAYASIKAHGGNSTWDRLAEYLESAVSSQEIFVINRSIAAPIATVFDMWTTPAHLAAWLPPAGFTMVFNHADIRAGGDATFLMSNGTLTMYARHVYVQMRRSDRLEYLQTFTDQHGETSRHPGMPGWPETTLVTVVFAEEGPTATRVTVRFEQHGVSSPEEVAAFVGERARMTLGWSGSFDVLDGLLAGADADTGPAR
jgi:uncharacterized protein YndB with AHSA1/START domain